MCNNLTTHKGFSWLRDPIGLHGVVDRQYPAIRHHPPLQSNIYSADPSLLPLYQEINIVVSPQKFTPVCLSSARAWDEGGSCSLPSLAQANTQGPELASADCSRGVDFSGVSPGIWRCSFRQKIPSANFSYVYGKK